MPLASLIAVYFLCESIGIINKLPIREKIVGRGKTGMVPRELGLCVVRGRGGGPAR